jgi:hypothetical protein
MRVKKAKIMKNERLDNEDTQIIDLTWNYENLEDKNKDKLLIIGKKLLSIKSLVQNENKE